MSKFCREAGSLQYQFQILGRIEPVAGPLARCWLPEQRPAMSPVAALETGTLFGRLGPFGAAPATPPQLPPQFLAASPCILLAPCV